MAWPRQKYKHPNTFYAAVLMYRLDMTEKFCNQSPKIATKGMKSRVNHLAPSYVVWFS
jgi:hypothetical protein